MEETSKKHFWARFSGRGYLENGTEARLKATLGGENAQPFLH